MSYFKVLFRLRSVSQPYDPPSSSKTPVSCRDPAALGVRLRTASARRFTKQSSAVCSCPLPRLTARLG